MLPQVWTLQDHKWTLLACFCLLFVRCLSSFPLFFFNKGEHLLCLISIWQSVHSNVFICAVVDPLCLQKKFTLFARVEIARVTRKAFFIQVLGVDVIFKKFNFCCLKFTFSTTQHIWGLSFRSVHQSSVTFQKVPVLCFIFTRLPSSQSFFCFSVFVVVNVWHAIRTIYFLRFRGIQIFVLRFYVNHNTK